jgi:phage terminase small subunit
MADSIRPEVRKLMDLADELGLTEFQRRFCEALASDPDRNQTQAALKAGAAPKSAHVQATRTIRLAKAQTYMAALTKTATELSERKTGRRVMGLAEALGRMTELAESDMTDFVDEVDGELKPSIKKAIDAGKGHLVQEFQLEEGADKDGLARTKTRFKLYDKKDALDKIIRHHGGYKDAEKPPEDRAPIRVQILQVLATDPEARRLVDALALKSLPVDTTER